MYLVEKMKIFNTRINVIHLEDREDRMKLLIEELFRQGISPSGFQIWHSEKRQPTEIAIAEAHKRIVAEAKRQGLQFVVIAEDDICFPSPVGWWHFLRNIPDDEFDIYLGGVYQGQQHHAQLGFTGMHLYCVHNRFYDKFLALTGNGGIDNEISALVMSGQCKARLCWPMAAIQHETISDNNGTINKHQHWFNEASVYGFKANP